MQDWTESQSRHARIYRVCFVKHWISQAYSTQCKYAETETEMHRGNKTR